MEPFLRGCAWRAARACPTRASIPATRRASPPTPGSARSSPPASASSSSATPPARDRLRHRHRRPRLPRCGGGDDLRRVARRRATRRARRGARCRHAHARRWRATAAHGDATGRRTPVVVYLPEGMRPEVLALRAVGGSIDARAARGRAGSPTATRSSRAGWRAPRRGPGRRWRRAATASTSSTSATRARPGARSPAPRPMAGLAADVISITHGTNCWTRTPHSAGMMLETTRAFLDIVRQGHPDTPIVVASPVLRPDAETTPTGWAPPWATCAPPWRTAVAAAHRRRRRHLVLVPGAARHHRRAARRRHPPRRRRPGAPGRGLRSRRGGRGRPARAGAPGPGA